MEVLSHWGKKQKPCPVDIGHLVIEDMSFIFQADDVQLEAVAEVSVMSSFHLLDAWKELWH